jgi:hypothetical protein
LSVGRLRTRPHPALSPCPPPPCARSKYGCQWAAPCGNCSAGSALVSAATAAIRAVDPDALISVNGMGQDGAGGCAGEYRGMSWGDGFITDKKTLASKGLSDPSFLFQ